MSFTIYHNPKCSKSREALELLKMRKVDIHVMEYLKTPPSESELLALIGKLDTPAASLVRTKEESFKSEPFDLDSARTIAKKLAERPILIERPIIVYGERAIIGRPTEKILSFF